jgi:hypothetical protein
VARPARLAAALLAAALAAPAAHAARIEGAVSQPSGGVPAAPVAVELFTYASGWQPAQQTQTDASGNFAFADLAAPGAYWIAPRYQGVLYPGEVVQLAPAEATTTRSVNFSLYEHTETGPAVSTTGLALIVEPEEAGVFRIMQELYFDNPEEVVIARKPEGGQPLARVGIAAGHGALDVKLYPSLPVEFKENAGQLELFGPLFPAQQVVRIEYPLTGTGRDLEMELVLAQDVGEIRMLLPPAGFSADAPGLHPGPMERSETGALRHLTFRGFNLPAGTRIPLRLTARSAPAAFSEPAALGLLLLLLGVGAAVVLQPALASAKFGAPAAPGTAASPEKEALFGALRDLEEDFAQGKVSSEDRARMREELLEEAKRTLARAREPEQTEPAAAPASAGAASSAGAKRPRFCSNCGHEHERAARFCSSCGRAIA